MEFYGVVILGVIRYSKDYKSINFMVNDYIYKKVFGKSCSLYIFKYKSDRNLIVEK